MNAGGSVLGCSYLRASYEPFTTSPLCTLYTHIDIHLYIYVYIHKILKSLSAFKKKKFFDQF